MIYVPNYTSGNCVVVRSENIVRKYSVVPTYNSNVNYIDYYIHSDYIEQPGVQNFTSYSTLPTCIASNQITTDSQYRVDYDKVLVIFLIVFIFSIYFPSKLFMTFFRKR